MSKIATRTRFAAALAAAAVLSLAACAKPLEVSIPEAVVAPGSSVAVGETVLVPGSAYEVRDDGRFLVEAEVGLTIAEVKHEDASWFDKLDNPEDFAGYAPVLVSTQVDRPEGSELESPNAAGPFGVLDNGEYTEFLSTDGFKSMAEFCWGSNFGISSAGHRLDCTVLLIPDGAALASMGWDGQASSQYGVNAGIDADDPRAAFIEEPLVIEVPAAE